MKGSEGMVTSKVCKNVTGGKLAVILLVVGIVSSAFAAPDGEYLCYKPDDKLSDYPWDAANWWSDGVSSSTYGFIPTSSTHVFLYSSKNNVANGKPPMVITNGVNAATGKLTVCDKDNGAGFVIGITVKNGGTMTNSGLVTIGGAGSGKTSGGRLIVENGGVWTANGGFRLGFSEGTSWLNIEEGGVFSCAQSGTEFLAGYNYGSGIVTNEGTMSVYDFFAGNYGTGIFVNKGVFNVARKFTIARENNSRGYFILESDGTLNKTANAPIYIANGANSTGILECNGDFTLANNDYIVVGKGENSTGRLVVGEGACVSNVASIAIGTNTNSRGIIELRGGTLWVNGAADGQTIALGQDGNTTTGYIKGWGGVRCAKSTLRVKFFGQVVADGEGESRDLNLASIRTVGASAEAQLNSCGTNGWYAANKGRLIYPRAQNCKTTSDGNPSHPTVGDYPNRAEPTVMNSFRYTLETNPAVTYYNFAELYAPDREDIPAGLPIGARDVVAGVWRFGLSSATNTDGDPTPAAFGGMSITFRYDWRDMPEDCRVAVYRHDGSAGGSWQRVAKGEISSSENTITTAKFDSTSEKWNAGWFAVVAETPKGLSIIFR